jgi:hypothetical protein
VNGAGRRLLACAVLLFAAPARDANAAPASYTLGDQAVVQIWAGSRADITVRTWDRPAVQFDTTDDDVRVTRRTIPFGTVENPMLVTIPLVHIRVHDPTGAIVPSTLPPEDFPYAPSFRRGVHDSLRVVAGAGAHLTVMIPAGVAILDARIRGTGTITIDGYQGGTLFVGNYGGLTRLTNVAASAAFVQITNGRLDVDDSTYERLRVRGNGARFVFARTHVRQVEVSTVSGPIVFDDGTFASGLARFESRTGSIAIGTSSGAQIDARSAFGRVLGLWDKRTPLEMRGDNDVTATIDGGGPVVNAVTERGNIYLYDGSLATRKPVPPEWRRVAAVLQRAEFPDSAGADDTAPPAFDTYRKFRPN